MARERREYFFFFLSRKCFNVWMWLRWEMEQTGMLPGFWLSFGRTSLLGSRGDRNGKGRMDGRKRSKSVYTSL